MTERPRRGGLLQSVKRSVVAGISVTSIVAAGGVAWRTAKDSGTTDETIRQLRRDVDRQRDQLDWMFKTLFRLPAVPAGPGGAP